MADMTVYGALRILRLGEGDGEIRIPVGVYYTDKATAKAALVRAQADYEAKMRDGRINLVYKYIHASHILDIITVTDDKEPRL